MGVCESKKKRNWKTIIKSKISLSSIWEITKRKKSDPKINYKSDDSFTDSTGSFRKNRKTFEKMIKKSMYSKNISMISTKSINISSVHEFFV